MRTRLRSRIRSRWWDEEQAVVFFYCGQPRACFSCGKRYPVCFSLVCRWSEFFWWSFFSCVNVESLKFKELFKSFTPAQFAISKNQFLRHTLSSLLCVIFFYSQLTQTSPHSQPFPRVMTRVVCKTIMQCGLCSELTPPIDSAWKIAFGTHAMANPERKIGIPVDESQHSENACDCKYYFVSFCYFVQS